MSCGDPHETPCSEVLEAVYLYLDGEQDTSHREKVRIHLDECAPCSRTMPVSAASWPPVPRVVRHELRQPP